MHSLMHCHTYLCLLQILHVAIDSIERGKSGGVSAVVCLKDFRRLLFEFQAPEDCLDMMDALEALSKPGKKNPVKNVSVVYALSLPP